MSKEDIIPVYMVGINKGDYKGVYGITHDLDEAIDLLSFLMKRRANDDDNDLRFRDAWLVKEQMYIELYEHQEVGKYLNCNCDNVSNEDAKKLAEEHGFTLEEINFHHW